MSEAMTSTPTATDELVKRLRTSAAWLRDLIADIVGDRRESLLRDARLLDDGADRLEALRAENAGLREATHALLHAACGDIGFAAAVRADTGKAYPWPALDDAEEKANRFLSGAQVERLSQPSPETIAMKTDIAVLGRCNGMSEIDRQGSYLKLVYHDQGENRHLVISDACAENLFGELRGALSQLSEFKPDWTQTEVEKAIVALSLALPKHVPGWPGCTDEQMEAVARAAIADVSQPSPAPDGWQSINDNPPPPYTRVWVWWPKRELDDDGMPTGPISDGSCFAAVYGGDGRWDGPEWFENQPNADYWGDSAEHSDGPTFWRELPPEPPEADALIEQGRREIEQQEVANENP